VGSNGKTAQQWRDVYLQMRALRVKKFYLTAGDMTIQVVAQEFTYSQRPLPAAGQPMFDVSFMVYQQDDIAKTLPLGS